MVSTRRFHAAGRWLLAVVMGILVVGLVGCSPKPQFGDKKSDWAKTAPPPQWRGPGQPSGPPAGALNGPATPVPPSVANASGRGPASPGR